MASDDFRIVTLRAAGNKAAALEGFTNLSQGDSVKVVVRNLPGADRTSLRFYLFSKADPSVALISPATGFQLVPGTSDSFYATASIASDNLATALDTVEPGSALTVRAYVADSYMVWVDCDLDVLPSPHTAETSWPAVTPPFAAEADVVLKADLLAGVTPILTMPTLTAADREARMNALLTLLNDLAQ